MPRGLRGLGLIALFAVEASGAPPKTQISIWAQPSSALGGATYGTAGAMIAEQRDIEIAANGEARLANVAATADPASMQLRDLTDPAATLTEQRFQPAAKTPTEILVRRIGEQVTVVTPKGDVTGILRAVDKEALVLETGAGDARRVSVMRRDYALDVRISGPAHDKPGVVWRIATTKPGKHAVELTYRAEGLSWAADYLAVLDEPGKLVDFSAWGTVKNATGAVFEGAEVTLISGTLALAAKPTAPPTKFTVPHPVRLGADTVQVELFAPRVGSKVRSVVAFEAMPDPSAEAQDVPNEDCSMYNGTDIGGGRSEVALELDVPGQAVLPDGRVRLFRRKGTRVELVSEDQLRLSQGIARIKLAAGSDITGERRALTCNPDERAHLIRERIEVKVENKGTQPADVVIREFMWRWPVWKIEAEDHKGVRAGPQTQEYRVRVPAKGAQTVTYTAVYSW